MEELTGVELSFLLYAAAYVKNASDMGEREQAIVQELLTKITGMLMELGYDEDTGSIFDEKT